MASVADDVRDVINKIYGPAYGPSAFERIAALAEGFGTPGQQGRREFSEADTVLITYGDTMLSKRYSPLQALHRFACQYLKAGFSAVHLLPFFTFSSDDGFSVIDYRTVNPEIGTWQDVTRFGRDFDLMFDYVLNHISSGSRWFERYLKELPGYQDLAIEVDPQIDLSAVTRPRALPLLTPFTKASGASVHVWTTFSEDQIDLNYKSLDVLLKMVEVLLFYVHQGARLIRMDAVAYLWKQIGTSCIHLPQTHDMVRLFRKILDWAAPEVAIITETNVPHLENVSYFGDGYNEAQMVYNFTLPPLLLHAFHTGSASVLGQWAQTLSTPSEQTTFFNFTGSHDGIGIRPLEGILAADEIERLAELARRHGGEVSSKANQDGSKSPYELNLTYLDAMSADPAKFLASQAIQLSLPGVPAVYIHSLLGSRNWQAGVELTGRARTINRQQLDLSEVLTALDNPQSYRSSIFYPYCRMLQVRRAQPAFHPHAGFDVIPMDQRVFCLRRFAEDQVIYALTNIVDGYISTSLRFKGGPHHMRDLLSNQDYLSDALRLEPYQTLWLVDLD